MDEPAFTSVPADPKARFTITQAIQKVMRDAGRPMTIKEAHGAIVAANLYQFKTDYPIHIVRNAIRKHCYGLDLSSASPKKLFKLTDDGLYFLLDSPVQQPRQTRREPKRGAANA